MRDETTIIRTNTLLFADYLCDMFSDMVGLKFVTDRSTYKEAALASYDGFIMASQFLGVIHGNYIIAMEMETAHNLTRSVLPEETADNKGIFLEEASSDFLKEIMNPAVGDSIIKLEDIFGPLTFVPPVVAIGKAIFPKVASGSVVIEGEMGRLSCIVSLNKASLKIAERLKTTITELEAVKDEVNRDSMTQLYNHAFFKGSLAYHAANASRNRALLSMAIIDIDNFRSFNTNYGHQAGDFVIKEVSTAIGSNVRSCDIGARYGGDEFAVIFPDADLKLALEIAEKILAYINSSKYPYRIFNQIEYLKVTLSIGVAQIKPNETATELIRRADECLYKAKKAGKNKVFGV